MHMNASSSATVEAVKVLPSHHSVLAFICPSLVYLVCIYIYKETMDILIQMFMENLEGNKKLCVVLCH